MPLQKQHLTHPTYLHCLASKEKLPPHTSAASRRCLINNNSTSSDGHGPAVMDAVPTILSMSYSTTRTACCGPSAYGRSSVAVSIHTRASCTAATATNQLLLST